MKKTKKHYTVGTVLKLNRTNTEGDQTLHTYTQTLHTYTQTLHTYTQHPTFLA